MHPVLESSPGHPHEGDPQELTDPHDAESTEPGPARPGPVTFRLAITEPSGETRRVVVTDEVQFIGRDPACEIPLADTAASRRHCAVQLAGDGRVLLTDGGSANGTYVGQERVDDATLVGGEVIIVGTSSLRLERDPPREDVPAARTAGETLAPVTADALVETLLREPPAAGPYLEITLSSGEVSYAAVGDEELVIGRDEGCEIPLPDAAASRRHCSVQLSEGRAVYLRDLESGNGTRIDGEVVAEGWLWGGERVSVGGTVLVLHGLPEPPTMEAEPVGREAWASLDATVFHNEAAGDLRGMPLGWRGLVRVGRTLLSAELHLDAPLVPGELRCLRVHLDAPLAGLSTGDEVAAYYEERRVASGTVLQLLDATVLAEAVPRVAYVRTGGMGLPMATEGVLDLGDRQVSVRMEPQDGPFGPRENGHLLLHLAAPLSAEDGERIVLFVEGRPIARGYLGPRRQG